jgi:hypothetical protein
MSHLEDGNISPARMIQLTACRLTDVGGHMSTEQDAAYRRARQRVAALRSFYVHLVVYVIVNAFLFLINIVTSPNSLWFYWPLLGWGIALLIHAVFVFGFGGGGWLGPDWEQRKVQEYVDREQKP